MSPLEPITDRHAENHRYVDCPACGEPEASEYDIYLGHTAEDREAGGIVEVVIACGRCGAETKRAP